MGWFWNCVLFMCGVAAALFVLRVLVGVVNTLRRKPLPTRPHPCPCCPEPSIMPPGAVVCESPYCLSPYNTQPSPCPHCRGSRMIGTERCEWCDGGRHRRRIAERRAALAAERAS